MVTFKHRTHNIRPISLVTSYGVYLHSSYRLYEYFMFVAIVQLETSCCIVSYYIEIYSIYRWHRARYEWWSCSIVQYHTNQQKGPWRIGAE